MFGVNFIHKIQGVLTAELRQDAQTIQICQHIIYWNLVTGAPSNNRLGWTFALRGVWFQKGNGVQGSLDLSRYSLLQKSKWEEEGSIF